MFLFWTMSPHNPQVTVIGCGLLGTKIIGTLVYYGWFVSVYDNDSSALDSLRCKLKEDFEEQVNHGLVSTKWGVYYICSSLDEAVKNADIIIEAIAEDVRVKQAFYQRLSKLCREDTIVVSSSLNLNLEKIFRDLTNKQRALGLRFLFPVYYIKDVEITRTRDTSDENFAIVLSFIGSLNKTTFVRKPNTKPLILSQEERHRLLIKAKSVQSKPSASALNNSNAACQDSSGEPCEELYLLSNPPDEEQIQRDISDGPFSHMYHPNRDHYVGFPSDSFCNDASYQNPPFGSRYHFSPTLPYIEMSGREDPLEVPADTSYSSHGLSSCAVAENLSCQRSPSLLSSLEFYVDMHHCNLLSSYSQ